MSKRHPKVDQVLCDQTIHQGAKDMAQAGIPIEMILDRLLTFAAAQACRSEGARRAATAFRSIADEIDAGKFTQGESFH